MRLKYLFERLWPYILSLILLIIFIAVPINKDKVDIEKILDPVITMVSIIIGFIGAIIPLILGSKKESKIVKYILEKDNQQLLMKYLLVCIKTGLSLIVISFIVAFRDIIEQEVIRKICLYIWIYVILLFLCLTYRCMSYVFNLIFINDPRFYENSRNAMVDMSNTEKEYKS